jgi:hypothetical protein
VVSYFGGGHEHRLLFVCYFHWNLGANKKIMEQMNKSAKQKVKEDMLMAMYRSVDRMNTHWASGNNAGVIAEKFYQANLWAWWPNEIV